MTSRQNTTGQQLAALAYAVPPITPEGNGNALVLNAVVITFTVISTVIVGLRVWVRLFLSDADTGRTWGVDDYLAVLGFVSRKLLC